MINISFINFSVILRFKNLLEKMSKAANMAKVSARGGFNLLWGLVASTVISAVGTIFIANSIGDVNFGLFTIALVAPNLISLFRDWGVSTAMIKYTAQYNAEDKAAEIRSIFVTGILFETILGVALSAVAFLLSGLLASLYSLPKITPLIQISSFMILTGALLSTAQSAFTGIEKLELNSVTLISQSIVKTVVSIVLVIIGLGPLGAVIGYQISLVTSCLIGVFLMWTIYMSLPKPAHGKLEVMATMKTLLNYGLPMQIAGFISSFQSQFYAFILPIFVRPDLIGNYGIANTVVVLISFFSVPIATVLFPAFSKLDPKKDRETLQNAYQFSVKYASLFVVPVAAIVMTLSVQGIHLLFAGKYSEAPLFLSLLAFSSLFTAFGTISTGTLIAGQSLTKFNLKLTIISAVIGFPVGVVLISQFGVIGLIITNLSIGWPSTIIALRWFKKEYGVTVNWISSAKILLSSATASAATYTIITIAPLGDWMKLIIGAIIFTVVLVMVTLLARTIDRTDINNLKDMLKELGPFRGLFNFLLKIIEKLMNALKL